ncbi:MAG: hypothetical protein E6767_15590 [Dysgonomonas sp.]|nr:hypothetical protein [Dysgonomonas sp.]
MAIENDKIKDLFASKLGSFEPEVPASVWGGLDQLLSNMPIPTADPSSSAVPDPSSSASSSATNAASAAGKASIIKTAAISVGLVAAVVTGVLVLPDKEKVQTPEPEPVVTEVIDSIEDNMVDTLDNTFVMPLPTLKQFAQAELPKEEDIPEIEPINEADLPEKEEKEIEEFEFKEQLAESITFWPDIAKKLKGASVGFVTNAGLLADQGHHQGGGVLFSRRERSTAFNNLLDSENSEYILDHKQPISFGVTFSKEISSNLSLETGLVYTHLSSKITSTSKFQIEEKQSFDYLGIPLNLNYTFYKLGKAKFYLTVGGMIQKDIKGQYTSHLGFTQKDITDLGFGGGLFYEEPYYIKNSIKQSNPQFSVHSNLGVAYPLYKKLYIYSTIGGAYYFDAGNKYRTIYSDKKTQLDLNLGIKFDF